MHAFSHRGLAVAFSSVFVLLTAQPGLAQSPAVETVVTTTTTADGVVREYGPQSVVIATSGSAEPARYVFRDSTTYVDELGQPVAAASLRAGLPVAIHYVREGDALIASRVIVRNSPAPVVAVAETTAVTSTGLINTYGPEGLAVRTETSADPVFYHLSRTTSYVDESGAPVAAAALRSGLPVTVHYTRSPDGLLASKVVVRQAAVVVPAAPPAQVIERTTTTTTTTQPLRSADED